MIHDDSVIKTKRIEISSTVSLRGFYSEKRQNTKASGWQKGRQNV